MAASRGEAAGQHGREVELGLIEAGAERQRHSDRLDLADECRTMTLDDGEIVGGERETALRASLLPAWTGRSSASPA
jgi:hypothetical protein